MHWRNSSIITRPSARSCSIRTFSRSEFSRPFLNVVVLRHHGGDGLRDHLMDPVGVLPVDSPGLAGQDGLISVSSSSRMIFCIARFSTR